MFKVGDRVSYPIGLSDEPEMAFGSITYVNPDGTVNVAWDDGFDDGADNHFMSEELTEG